MKRLSFTADNARAVEEGRKTQTRRLLKPQPDMRGFDHTKVSQDDEGLWTLKLWSGTGESLEGRRDSCQQPRYQPGEVVAVTQPWRTAASWDSMSPSDLIPYLAPTQVPVDFDFATVASDKGLYWGRLRAAMHMPTTFAWLHVRITSVKAERVQDISEADAVAEGIWSQPYPSEYGMPAGETFYYGTRPNHGGGFDTAKQCYASLWDFIHGLGAWDLNPFVFAYSFEKVAR